MKNILQYLRKPHRIVGLINIFFSGFCTLCLVLYSNFPNWTKITALIMYIILLILAFASLIKRSSLINYMETVEKLFIREGISIQQNDIENLLQLSEVKGITDIKEKANYAEVLEHIYNAKNSIKIIVYHGNKFLNQAKEELIKAIKNDVIIQLIIGGRESDLLNEVWELEDGEKKAKWDDSFFIIKKIAEQTKNRPDLFSYQICNTQIRYALILVDNKWAWWTPYHPGVDVTETTSFILVKKGEKSIINQCRDHFGKLWFYLENKKNNNNEKFN